MTQEWNRAIENNFFLVNKPLNWTSFQVVNFIRRNCFEKKTKVGHAGTLDPLAEGLLIICSKEKTKTIAQYQAMSKIYEGTMVIGAQTASYDLECPIEKQKDIKHINMAMIEKSRACLTGTVRLKPPLYSAIKKDGEKMYHLARKNITIDLAKRETMIYLAQLTDIALPKIKFKIHCSTGTYIRSWVDQFGKNLGVGAYLSALTRTQIGDYKIVNALDVLSLKKTLIKP